MLHCATFLKAFSKLSLQGRSSPNGQNSSYMLQSQIAADNAIFGQTGPKVGSFDAGYGSTQMVRLVGQKKAREIWFLARLYNAQQVRTLR